MTSGEGVSTQEHLAEMDRLLREIQVELAPDREPAPPLDEPPPPTVDPAPPFDPAPPLEPPPPPPEPGGPQLQTLAQLTAHLLASMRELLDGYEQVLVQIQPRAARPRPQTPTQTQSQTQTPNRRHRDPGVTVTAGPFPSLGALNEFEQAVSHLPGVRDVAVRGYEGSDRAIIEVRLEAPSP